MRVEDLHHEELLELDPEGGVIRFAEWGLSDRKQDPLGAELALIEPPTLGESTPNVADQLLRYEWPGNVRELENAMERSVALARGSRVELADLPEEIRQAFPKPVLGGGPVQSLSDVEKEYILAVLRLNDGNQTRTAKQLRIGSATLYRKLKSYGLIGGKRPLRAIGLKPRCSGPRRAGRSALRART